MRFGLDGIPFEEKRTGVGHYTVELARSLAAIAPKDDFELISPDFAWLASAGLARNFRNLHFVNAGGNRLTRHGWWSITLPLYCCERSFDLFHGTNYELPYWSKCPTVLTIHDLSLLLFPHTHEKRLVRRARLKLPIMARKADAIITPSYAVKREVCEHLGVGTEKVFAIPEAARSAFYRGPRAESDPVRKQLGIEDEFILFVGTIEPRKNLITLVRAFEELLRHTSLRPQLVIAGKEGWLSGELMAYLRASQFKEHILITGHLSDDDLRGLYSSCRVFVYPSLYEGFGLPLLEAMMCGAPVITSNVPSIVETVGNAARLITPTDFYELARRIKGLLEDSNVRDHLSATGLRHANKFSWQKTASATFKVYQQVIASTKPKDHK